MPVEITVDGNYEGARESERAARVFDVVTFFSLVIAREERKDSRDEKRELLR